MTREQHLQQALSQRTLPEQVLIRAWNEADYPGVRDLALAEGWRTLHDQPDDGLEAWRHSWPAVVVPNLMKRYLPRGNP